VSPRHYAFVLVLALVVTAVVTPVVRRLALKYGLVDEPGGRKVHAEAIPRIGGVAIVSGFAVALAVQAAGEVWWGWGGELTEGGQEFAAVLAGLAVIFVVGLLDDLVTLSPGQKFIGQLVAAGVVIAWGPRVEFIADPFSGGLVYLGLMSIPITLVWILGFTNIINLIDGIDGLAAGITAIAAGTFLLLAAQSNQLVAAACAAALVGACLGFLRYNFPPASIFMGDSGALFLGFALATISLLGVMKSVAAITLVVPLLVIWVPIFDTGSAIIRRWRHGRPIQEADRGHIHHRLLGRGFDQRQTVLIIYAWSILLAFGGYAMRWVPTVVKLGVFLVLAILTAFMAYWLGIFEAAHHHPEDEG
jgi:UDP-GlcNAc:undecaprenyl-phosphate GlcNAc-1-phosphate transferase